MLIIWKIWQGGSEEDGCDGDDDGDDADGDGDDDDSNKLTYMCSPLHLYMLAHVILITT